MYSSSLPAKGLFRLSSAQKSPKLPFPLGLGVSGVHEVCETSFGDFSALTGFAIAACAKRKGTTVWISQTPLTREHGRGLQVGLTQLTTSSPAILSIAANKLSDALWATEEALRSTTAGLVIAELQDVDFTASRRLTLASSRYGTPVVLLMPSTRTGATAASARWRVSPRPSAPNPYDASAPGAVRWRAVLERSRQVPHMARKSFNLELDDETLSLRVVPGLATHSSAAGKTRPAYGNSAVTNKRSA